MSNELGPCPFCKGELMQPAEHKEHAGVWLFECGDCGNYAAVNAKDKQGAIAALAAWDRGAP